MNSLNYYLNDGVSCEFQAPTDLGKVYNLSLIYKAVLQCKLWLFFMHFEIHFCSQTHDICRCSYSATM